jgi:hypothetical protein
MIANKEPFLTLSIRDALKIIKDFYARQYSLHPTAPLFGSNY